MLRWRLLSAALLLTVFCGFLSLDYFQIPPFAAPGVWLLPILLLVTVLTAHELIELLAAKHLQPRLLSTYAGVLLVVVSAMVPMVWPLFGHSYPPDCSLGHFGWPLMGFVAAVGISFLAEMRHFDRPGHAVLNIAAGLFVVGYVGVMLSFFVPLRLFGSHAWGFVALLSVIVVVKLSDAGAYFVGRAAGRHKLSPRVSPGKTVEGALGGLAAAVAGAYLYFFAIAPLLLGEESSLPTWWGCLLFAVLVAVAGILGDLAESLIKRDVQQKDSSTWLPGLGGVLDTLDSLLLAVPVALACWLAGLVGPAG